MYYVRGTQTVQTKRTECWIASKIDKWNCKVAMPLRSHTCNQDSRRYAMPVSPRVVKGTGRGVASAKDSTLLVPNCAALE